MLKKYLIPWLFLLLFISNSSVAVLPGEEEGACALPSASSSQTVPKELQSNTMQHFGDKDIGDMYKDSLDNRALEMQMRLEDFQQRFYPGKDVGGCSYCAQAVFELAEGGYSEQFPTVNLLMDELAEATAAQQREADYMISLGQKPVDYAVGSRNLSSIYKSIESSYSGRTLLINGEVPKAFTKSELSTQYEVSYEDLVNYEESKNITVDYAEFTFKNRFTGEENNFYYNDLEEKWMKVPDAGTDIDEGLQRLDDLKTNEAAIALYKVTKGEDRTAHAVAVLRQKNGWLVMETNYEQGGFKMGFVSSREDLIIALKKSTRLKIEAKFTELNVLTLGRE